MLGNIALNLSVDAGLSLVNDVIGAVSGNLSSRLLPSQGNTGSSAGYGSSGFGGQGSFGEMLNNSIDSLSNAYSSVSGGGQNQGGAVQPASVSFKGYGGSQADNASVASAPVSQTVSQPNSGLNSASNNNGGAQPENNISGRIKKVSDLFIFQI
jgi:hypothetical protein